MRQREETERKDDPKKLSVAERKPYQKPKARCERVFEVNALACTKKYGVCGAGARIS